MTLRTFGKVMPAREFCTRSDNSTELLIPGIKIIFHGAQCKKHLQNRHKQQRTKFELKMAESGVSVLIQYFMGILAKFNTFSMLRVKPVKVLH